MTERSDNDVLMGKSVTVVLGEKEFLIEPQVRKRSRAFRCKLNAILDGADEVIELCIAASSTDGTHDMGLGKAVGILKQFITVKADEALDLIYEYDPSLAIKDTREYIEDNATDEQCIKALMVILKLVFVPFVKLVSQVPIQMQVQKKVDEIQKKTETISEDITSP